jgi:hypothetical protein
MRPFPVKCGCPSLELDTYCNWPNLRKGSMVADGCAAEIGAVGP